MTCDALLDHRSLPEMVRSCILARYHEGTHALGPWRAPTKAETKKLELARPKDYPQVRGQPVAWTEGRVRRFSR